MSRALMITAETIVPEKPRLSLIADCDLCGSADVLNAIGECQDCEWRREVVLYGDGPILSDD